MFDDFLDVMIYGLQRDDESYLETIEPYDREEVQLYAEAFGELQQAMSETNADLLGIVYEEMGHSSDQFGQHFTPHNLCDSMAEMTIGPVEDRDEPYTVLDPASGSGRLLISAAQTDPDGVFYGVDKDPTCAKMTALNLCFFNMDGYAVLGDSLKMDYRKVWATRNTAMGGVVRELEQSEFTNPYEQDPIPDDVDNTEHSSSPSEKEAEMVDFEEVRETTLFDFKPGENQG